MTVFFYCVFVRCRVCFNVCQCVLFACLCSNVCVRVFGVRLPVVPCVPVIGCACACASRVCPCVVVCVHLGVSLRAVGDGDGQLNGAFLQHAVACLTVCVCVWPCLIYFPLCRCCLHSSVD